MKYASALALAFLVACSSEGGGNDNPMSQADGAAQGSVDSSTPMGTADAANVPTPDASTTPPPDASVTGGVAGEVNCGGTSCNLNAGDICCISISGSQCTAESDCSDGFTAPQHCDGPEDCGGGQACCAVFMLGGDIGSFCRDTCSTSSAGDEAELCHITADCSDAAETCKTCQFTGAPMPQNACAGDDIPACQ